MDYCGIGFSNIRLQNDRNNYIYKYSSISNTFPEEVFVHEFLHSLERNLMERGYDIPALHDNEKYGYKNEPKVGLKKWYEDYMQLKILDQNANKYIGLDSVVYKLKPINVTCFENTIKIDEFEENNNIFIGFFTALKNGINVIRNTVEGT